MSGAKIGEKELQRRALRESAVAPSPHIVTQTVTRAVLVTKLKPGRKRIHASAAERQRAYRQRKAKA
jgi:hypothetical protein